MDFNKDKQCRKFGFSAIKGSHGITLITLVITIIVLLILAGVATYSGIEAIENTRYTKFMTELKIMQTYVNEWYEDCKPDETADTEAYETEFRANIAAKFNNIDNAEGDETAENSITQAKEKVDIIKASPYTDFYILDDNAKEQLGIEGVSQIVLVNVRKRAIVSYYGLKFKGEMYYTLDEANEFYNVNYKAQGGNPLFSVSYTYNKNSDLYNVSIDDINYDGAIAKWNVKYRLAGEDSWNVSKELKFTIKKLGKYEFKLFNGAVETEETDKQEVMIVPVENIQSIPGENPQEISGENTQYNYYLIMMSNTKNNFADCTNVGTIEEFRNLFNAGNFNYDIAYVIEDINIGGTEENQWTPIGTSSKNFDKVFDGQNHVIDGVYIKGNKTYQGLFRKNTGTVKNINANNFIIDISTTKDSYTAGIVAYNQGTVENCTLKNSQIKSNEKYAGGIVGVNNSGTIKNCKNYTDILGEWYVAGIAGYSQNSSTIENSCNFGDITSQSNEPGSGSQMVSRVGGIAGSNANSSIKNCYNEGKVLGNGIQIGGIVGISNTSSVVENSYNDGDVATTSLDSSGVSGQIGGVVGANLTGSTIKKCYNNKSVAGGKNSNVGGIAGLCGYTTGGKGYIENCYNAGSISANKAIAGIAGGLSDGSITNCYNVGQIVSNNSTKGAITSYSSTTQGTRDITNCYYLTGTCTGGINSADEAGKAESRTSSQMKADAFVTLLNGNGDVWQNDIKSVNNGYPVLKK